MKKVLHIMSSVSHDASYSIQLGHAIINKLKAQYGEISVSELDLNSTPLPYLDARHIQAFYTPVEHLTDEDRNALYHSDKAIEDLMAADIIVIGAPLYNFGIHSSLKSWIDHICRAGITFRYTEQGPEGLVKGKKVYIAMAAGGIYSSGPYQAYDFVSPYLKAVLGFLGMTDVSLVSAEGVKMPGVAEHALKKAIDSIAV